MALDTYANLQVEIADWLDRSDLTARIPTFITLLEAQAERTLMAMGGVRDMETRSYATLSTQFLALPADYLGLKSVQLNTNPVTIPKFVPMNELDKIRRDYGNAAGRPIAYSILGNEIEFAPAPDTSYEVEIVYWAKIPRLSGSQTTNWMLTKHPDVYLFGSLLQAAPYLHGDERIATWGGALGGIMEQIRTADEVARMSGQPLKMRFRPYGPQARSRR